MATIKECSFVFIAGVEGSGTTVTLPLLDRMEGFICLGGNYFSENYKQQGTLLNKLTKSLWNLSGLPEKDRLEILAEINNIEVGDANTIIYKRSYPFFSSQHMPDLSDLTAIGENQKIILMRRHFFDSVNSILRRGFEGDVDIAVQRICDGHTHLYKQSLLANNDGLRLHLMDYDELVCENTKEDVLGQLSKYLGQDAAALQQYKDMIGKPIKHNVFVQK